MQTVTIPVRSIAWFATGAMLATAVTLMFANAWRVDAAPGDDDATFVSMTPCRLADTRPAPQRVGPASTLGTAETETFAAVGANGECTIPSDAVGLSLNITALGATQQSFLTVWPAGEQPLAASLNPSPGQPPIPNAVSTDLSPAGGFNIYNDAGNVDLVIDVNGYYTSDSLIEITQRLAALETAQQAGVDPTVLSRLTANEEAITEVDTRLSEDVAVLQSDVADANREVIFLLDRRARSVESSGDQAIDVGTAPVIVRSLTYTARAAGYLTVNSTAYAVEGTPDRSAWCSLTTGSTLDFSYLQFWQSGTNNTAAQLSGTRRFIVGDLGTITVNLVCQHNGGASDAVHSMRDSAMTGVYTPF